MIYKIYRQISSILKGDTFYAQMEFIDILALFLSCLFLCFWWKRWSVTGGGPKNLPPGPPGWPILGNLGQIVLQRRHFIFTIPDLRAKYGPIFTLQMGQRTLVVISSPDLIHEALVRKGPLFASRPADSPTRLLFSFGKCAINSAEYGPLWRTLRRNLVAQVTAASARPGFSWARQWALDSHLDRLHEELERNGKIVEVMPACRLTACSILICICFGAKLPDHRIKRIEAVLKDVMLMTAPKLPDFLPVLTPLFRGHLKAARELRRDQIACLGPLISARRKFVESGGSGMGAGNESGTHDSSLEMVSPVGAAYIDSLFRLEPGGRGRLGEEELVTLVSEVINAGTDSTATTVEWALLHLVLDQGIQDRLYEEIVDRVGKGPAAAVNENDVEKMPYLDAVVKETFRRHPPGHFMLSHATTEAAELGGYCIPPGVSVEFYTAWVTEDPKMWLDPGLFRPERFLEGGEGADVDVTGTRGVRMLPFGAGRRICPAVVLGTLHVKLMVARMVHAFKWVPVPGAPPDPTATFAFTVVLKNSLKAVILPR